MSVSFSEVSEQCKTQIEFNKMSVVGYCLSALAVSCHRVRMCSHENVNVQNWGFALVRSHCHKACTMCVCVCVCMCVCVCVCVHVFGCMHVCERGRGSDKGLRGRVTLSLLECTTAMFCHRADECSIMSAEEEDDEEEEGVGNSE